MSEYLAGVKPTLSLNLDAPRRPKISNRLTPLLRFDLAVCDQYHESSQIPRLMGALLNRNCLPIEFVILLVQFSPVLCEATPAPVSLLNECAAGGPSFLKPLLPIMGHSTTWG